jgi:opacity protein-like surface antigen
MLNAIGAIPLGLDDNWLPYVSGGVGAITLRNDLQLGGDTSLDLIDDNQFGGNIGFGVMGFMNQVGLRADVRYFTGIGTDDTLDLTDTNNVNDLTENVNFWRSTVGVSFRW